MQAAFTLKRNTRCRCLFINDILVKQLHLIIFDVFYLFNVSFGVLLGCMARIRRFL